MRSITMLVAVVLTLANYGVSAQQVADAPSEAEYLAWAEGILQSVDKKQGEVKLPNGVATLHVPDEFYYLNGADSEKILVEVWGNPPGAGSQILGMLFPADLTPFDQGAWAVTIEYQKDGYVSDEDADEIDYQALLAEMQKDTRTASEQRVAQGYDPIELIGWAAQPYYDKGSHKMYWAKEVRFGEQTINTLNYNVRMLGRQGVLVLNFIATMDQKDVIDAKVAAVLAVADFDEGSRYEDFKPDLDTVAAYGLGALVAGKVIAKTGLIAAGILFLKKFGIVALIAVGALASRWFRRKRR